MSDIADLELVSLDDVWVARLSGEIDLSNADAIGAAVEPVFGRGGIGLVLDLTDVEYLDSAGVRLLFRIVRSSTSRGWTLRAVVPEQSRVRRILDLAEIESVIGLDETPAPALSHVRSRTSPPGQRGVDESTLVIGERGSGAEPA